MVYTVPLDEKDIEKCREFSTNCSKTHQLIEFGQYDTPKRSLKETSRDILIGKLGEIAFSKWANAHHNIILPLDFNNYGHYKCDESDTSYRGFRIDIKTSRPGSRWLLVDISKNHSRASQNRLPHAYVFLTTGWDRTADSPLPYATLFGFASIKDMLPSTQNTLLLPKGSTLPLPSVALQATNVARHINHLSSSWTKFFSALKSAQPFNPNRFLYTAT
jgi:hypothetical protein